MASLIGYVAIGLALLIGAGAVISWVRKLWPTILPESVTNAVDKASAVADATAAGAACLTLATLFRKHGNTEAVDTIGKLWAAATAWDDTPAEPKT